MNTWISLLAAMVCVFGIRSAVLSGSLAASSSDGDAVRTRTVGADGQVTALIGALGAGVVLQSWLAAIWIGALVACTIGPVRRRLARRRESQGFRNALPQFVEALAQGLRGGLSPAQALIEGANDTARPFPRVFRPAATLLAAGSTASEAVSTWADARDDSDLRFLAAAMAVGQAVGGIDGRAADAVASALRERHSTDEIVRVQATQALYSAGVLCGAPVVFCAMVVLTDQRSSTFLLSSPLGRIIGLVGVGLDASGALWMKRMVRQVVQ